MDGYRRLIKLEGVRIGRLLPCSTSRCDPIRAFLFHNTLHIASQCHDHARIKHSVHVETLSEHLLIVIPLKAIASAASSFFFSSPYDIRRRAL